MRDDLSETRPLVVGRKRNVSASVKHALLRTWGWLGAPIIREADEPTRARTSTFSSGRVLISRRGQGLGSARRVPVGVWSAMLGVPVPASCFSGSMQACNARASTTLAGRSRRCVEKSELDMMISVADSRCHTSPTSLRVRERSLGSAVRAYSRSCARRLHRRTPSFGNAGVCALAAPRALGSKLRSADAATVFPRQ